jgi:hypothetical protein
VNRVVLVQNSDTGLPLAPEIFLHHRAPASSSLLLKEGGERKVARWLSRGSHSDSSHSETPESSVLEAVPIAKRGELFFVVIGLSDTSELTRVWRIGPGRVNERKYPLALGEKSSLHSSTLSGCTEQLLFFRRQGVDLGFCQPVLGLQTQKTRPFTAPADSGGFPSYRV